MLVSRALAFLQRSSRIAQPRRNPIKNQTRRKHDDAHHDPADGWVYRNRISQTPGWELGADMVGGLMWWWILHRMWYDWDHISGDKNYPNPKKFTDAELGIPPDDQVYENFNPDTCVYPPGFYDDVK